MFNRLLRCLILAKKPASLTPRRNCRPAVEAQPSVCDIPGTSKRRFSTKAVEKSTESEAEAAQESKDSNVPLLVREEQFRAMIESDPALEKLYKVLQLEIEGMRQGGKVVPSELKPHEWLTLFKLETRSARGRYLVYLFKLEMTKQNFRQKKELARIERERKWQELEREEVDPMSYRLYKNTIFLRIYDTTMHHFYHSRLMTAKMHGPEVIMDLGYDKHMTLQENSECAKQLVYLFAENRMSRDPFYLSFCNVNRSSVLMQKLYRAIPTLEEPQFPVDVNECSYTELYDKQRLVYLTPHCKSEMTEYEPDSIYIIGAMVDKTNNQPLSLAKAKKEGIRMAKFPLDKYMLWGSGGGKRLPLNQVLNILSDIRTTGDWYKALKHIPARKLEKPLGEFQNNKGFVPSQNPSWVATEVSRRSRYVPATAEKILPLNTSYTLRDRQKKSS